LVIKDNYMMEHFDISFNPSVVAYQAGGQSTLGLIVRAVSSQSPPPPPENTMRCLLVAKVKNCSAKFTFKCEFRFMTDDQGTSGSD
jgi:hypothetical protein